MKKFFLLFMCTISVSALMVEPANYSIANNKIINNFSYAPYTHYSESTYETSTKKLAGTFLLVQNDNY